MVQSDVCTDHTYSCWHNNMSTMQSPLHIKGDHKERCKTARKQKMYNHLLFHLQASLPFSINIHARKVFVFLFLCFKSGSNATGHPEIWAHASTAMLVHSLLKKIKKGLARGITTASTTHTLALYTTQQTQTAWHKMAVVIAVFTTFKHSRCKLTNTKRQQSPLFSQLSNVSLNKSTSRHQLIHDRTGKLQWVYLPSHFCRWCPQCFFLCGPL